MNVVLKRGEEAFKVLLSQSTLCDFLAAGVVYHRLHLVNRDVSILVDVGMVSQVCLEGIFGLELVLEESVDLDQVSLNVLELVSWHVLRIKHEHIIVENVTLDQGSEVRASTARDTISGLGNDALISLLIEVEGAQVCSHLRVLDLA